MASGSWSVAAPEGRLRASCIPRQDRRQFHRPAGPVVSRCRSATPFRRPSLQP